MERGAPIYVGTRPSSRSHAREPDDEAPAVGTSSTRATAATGARRASSARRRQRDRRLGPITASLGGVCRRARVRVRPGKGIHVVSTGALTNYAIAREAIDGRQIFLEPWQNMSVLGTTDDDFYGDLDDVRATSEEVRYLVQGVARVFPAIRAARAIGTYAGVRPTLYAFGPHEDALSREHEIVDHAAHGAPGRLLDDRRQARELPPLRRGDDRRRSRATSTSACPARRTRLAAARRRARARRRSRSPSGTASTPVAARRLVYRHGARATRDPRAARRGARARRDVVCACEPVLEAEVRHVVAHELARDVDDVARRTRLGLGACGGMRCAARCGQIVAEELGLAPARDSPGVRVPRAAGALARRRAGPGAGAARGADAGAPRARRSGSADERGRGRRRVAGTAAALAAARAGAQGHRRATAAWARPRSGRGRSTPSPSSPPPKRRPSRASSASSWAIAVVVTSAAHPRAAQGREGACSICTLCWRAGRRSAWCAVRGRAGAPTAWCAPPSADSFPSTPSCCGTRTSACSPTRTSPPATTTTRASAGLPSACARESPAPG